ncbi:P1 family peptidase [Pikeienuella sp. HZG-20]|uniref:P1 family peptidase n=1 Tax=Paludibacillus litoralis TaxID=3133267 RepID=UPI0030EC0A7E
MTAAYRPGPRNLITDVAGLKVGGAEDARVKTGVTVLTADRPFTAGVAVMGGAPGTRETELLAPDKLVQEVDALVLSGGSAFGLDAAGGVMAALAALGRGHRIGAAAVPITPAAILFDLLNGGDKDWGAHPPYADLGRRALAAAGADFRLGTAGAGAGATVAGLKGGLGSASLMTGSGAMVGALAAVNALGAATVPGGRNFWAAPFEIGAEFGGLGPAPEPPAAALTFRSKLDMRAAEAGSNTTIAIVATDAALTQAQATRVAWAAHDGMARALVPAHTLMDGDLVFAAATGARPLADGLGALVEIGHAAALCLARAIARAVYEATPEPGDLLPCWRDL